MTTINTTKTDRGFLVYSEDVWESSSADEPCAWVEGDSWDLDYIEEAISEGHRLAPELKAFVAVVETDPVPRWLEWEPGETIIPEKHYNGVSYEHRYGTVHEWLDETSGFWQISVTLHNA